MTKRQIAIQLQRLGVEMYTKGTSASITWLDTGHSIQVDFWNVDRVIPCRHAKGELDVIAFSVEFLWRKNDKIHCNINEHVLRDVSIMTYKDFYSLKTILDLKNAIHNAKSVGIKLVA